MVKISGSIRSLMLAMAPSEYQTRRLTAAKTLNLGFEQPQKYVWHQKFSAAFKSDSTPSASCLETVADRSLLLKQKGLRQPFFHIITIHLKIFSHNHVAFTEPPWSAMLDRWWSRHRLVQGWHHRAAPATGAAKAASAIRAAVASLTNGTSGDSALSRSCFNGIFFQ